MTKKDELKSVAVLVQLPWKKTEPCKLVKEPLSGKPDIGQYDDWWQASNRAIKVAAQYGLDEVAVRYAIGKQEFQVMASLTYDQSGNPRPFAVHPLVELERYLNRRGYETQDIGLGMYAVERPDAVGGIRRKRGFLDAMGMLQLTRLDNADIDEVLNGSWRDHMKSSKYTRYSLTPTIRGGSMGKKNEEKAVKPTAKGSGGKDVELSPTMVDTLEAIKKGEKSGKPLGSGAERLDDSTSIAAMKLARAGVVHRAKIGTRWHYFEKESSAKKAQDAAEKAAADAAKKTPKQAKSSKSPSKQVAGKKKSGPLKKPSDK